MSKRLQVLIEEGEYRRIQKMARRRGQTLAEWVRQALRAAGQEEPERDVERRLAAIRRAVTFNGPTCDIEQMLAETERGYLSDANP